MAEFRWWPIGEHTTPAVDVVVWTRREESSGISIERKLKRRGDDWIDPITEEIALPRPTHWRRVEKDEL